MENDNPYRYGSYPQKPGSVAWSKARVQIRRYLDLGSRMGWVLLLTMAMGVCLAAWVVSQMPPDYLSEARMIVQGQFKYNEDAAYMEQVDNYYGTQMEIMDNDEVQKSAMERVQALHPEYLPEKVTFEVTQEPHASVFILKAEAQTAAYAQAYLNAVMEAYIDKKKSMLREKSNSASVAIEDELKSLDKEIDSTDAEMHDFQKANNIGFLQQEGNDAAVYLAQKEKELADLKIEYNLLQMLDLDQNLDRQNNNAISNQSTSSSTSDNSGDGSDKQDAQALTSFGPIADYQKAKQQLELLQSQRAELAKNLRPAHPLMVALDEKIEKQNNLISTLRSQSVDALKTHRDSIQIQIQNLEGVIKEWEAKALDLSSRISEFDKIKTKSDRAKEEYERLLGTMQGVDVTKNTDQDQISVMEEASEGVSVKPGLPKIILIGVVGGLFVGLVILVCIDQLDDRVSSFVELQTHFPETVLGQIPRENLKDEGALLRPNDDRLALLEAFRSLRSSLIFFPVEGTRPKTLIITSALPNEGKTTISANLAITLAFSGARTLLVDADMRRGKLSQLFGVQEGNGLSSILLKTVPLSEAVHRTTIDNLSLVSCGPPLKHPAEHLLGKVADQFLKDVYDQYDYVIFDSPPVTLLDDTLSLAPKIDGAMIIVRFGVSSVRTTRRALELLGQRQTNILGVICNDVHLSESEYSYGYYYRQTVASYYKGARANA